MGLFALLSIVTLSSAFLLDGNTESPNRVSLMTDTHFNMLMGLLNDERQSRIQLEKYVKQLQQDLINSKQEVHTQVFQNMNATFDKQLKDLMGENNELKANNQKLQSQYDNLNLKFENFMRSQTLVKNDTLQLQQEVAFLQNLKNVANLKTILELDNKTETLGKTIEKTNKKLNQVAGEAEARKQDFLALFNKADGTAKTLENKTAQINTQLQNMTIQAQIIERKLSGKLGQVEAQQNVKLQQQSLKLQQHLDKVNNRAVLTTCKNANAVKSVIQFTNIKTINGIKNDTSIRNSGVFTCENSGLYIVSVYIQSLTVNGRFEVKRNSVSIAQGYTAPETSNVATASVTFVTHLEVSDKISVTGPLYVYDSYASCMSIVQIE